MDVYVPVVPSWEVVCVYVCVCLCVPLCAPESLRDASGKRDGREGRFGMKVEA